MVKKDSLTNLYNHRYFHERLYDEFSRCRRDSGSLSCIVCDIDHFKTINDTHGHQAGDIILQSLADTFLSMMRCGDVASRYGGEEFAFILPDTGISKGADIAEQIRRHVAGTPFRIADSDINVTISMGISCFPENRVTTPADLVRFADEALYTAKQTGRNKVVQAAQKGTSR